MLFVLLGDGMDGLILKVGWWDGICKKRNKKCERFCDGWCESKRRSMHGVCEKNSDWNGDRTMECM